MRKISVVLLAMALVFGMTQCKKRIETVTPTGNGNTNKIHITLDVENGGRHVVNPDTGEVTFDDGDVIYVGDGNKYIGSLTRKNGEFSGDIDTPTDANLHFYFVGGLEPSTTPTASSTTSFDVNISDQSVKLPTISHASVEYIPGTTSYSCTMLNKCGLVKFNLTNTDIPASQKVGVTGMNNSVTVQFNNATPYTSSVAGDGTVILNAVSAQQRWAILPIQNRVEDATVITYGHANATIEEIPAVTDNMYYTAGVTIPAMTVAPEPLTFEAKTDDAKVKLTYVTGVIIHMDYSTDGTTWETYNSGEDITLNNVGDKVMFRANGNNITMASANNKYSKFTITGDCYVYGNIMSLLYSDFNDVASFLDGSTYTLCGLFNNCNSLYSHPMNPLELPATTLANYCYYSMFRGCTNLTIAPELPATELADGCYYYMFQGCTGLTTAPELPATTLANYCYYSMFQGCTGLTTAPELPATTLAQYCYANMFQGCTGLTTAPELPATELADRCYYYMFNGCTSLNSITCLATDISASNCTTNWVTGVASVGTFTKASSMDSWTTGVNGIPSGWTVQDAAK